LFISVSAEIPDLANLTFVTTTSPAAGAVKFTVTNGIKA
jgi:hypothetical protein